ncbi:hypothetical protein MTP03_25120 [Tsukamurella sp. PLM1]|nr:hypothetical protein MTP03_25120 [Tsukamurella sp. PLM1]
MLLQDRDERIVELEVDRVVAGGHDAAVHGQVGGDGLLLGPRIDPLGRPQSIAPFEQALQVGDVVVVASLRREPRGGDLERLPQFQQVGVAGGGEVVAQRRGGAGGQHIRPRPLTAFEHARVHQRLHGLPHRVPRGPRELAKLGLRGDSRAHGPAPAGDLAAELFCDLRDQGLPTYRLHHSHPIRPRIGLPP